MIDHFRRTGRAFVRAALCTAVMIAAARAEPVALRIGVGPAAEEQVWLMKARPDLTPNQGKVYTYDMSMFRSGGDRTAALQAGQLDAITTSSSGALYAASKGVPLVVVASMAKESTKTFSTAYYGKKDSDVSLSNLKGKTIGINGYRTSIEFYARLAVQKAGLDPTRDVTWLVVPLPQMAEAVRRGQIDLGAFPTTFAFLAEQSGQFKKVFDSAGISGIEEEFDVAFTPSYVKQHGEAVRAFLADFATVTKYFVDHPVEARQALLDSKIVQADPAVYLKMTARNDLERSPDIKPDPAMFRRLQTELVKMGFQDSEIDINRFVDGSFLPK